MKTLAVGDNRKLCKNIILILQIGRGHKAIAVTPSNEEFLNLNMIHGNSYSKKEIFISQKPHYLSNCKR